MKSNQQKSVKLLSAVIAASAIVVMAVLAAALDQERTGTATGSVMTIGETVTHSKAPTTTTPIFSPVMKAKPPKGFR
jgi:hypothetical protein